MIQGVAECSRFEAFNRANHVRLDDGPVELCCLLSSLLVRYVARILRMLDIFLREPLEPECQLEQISSKATEDWIKVYVMT